MLDTIKGFHIEPTNVCTLKCSACSRTKFIQQWPQHWKNHNLDLKQLLEFLDIDLMGKQIILCGNNGDPIYHPDILDWVKEFKSKQSHIMIITNGSYKKESWWIQLTSLLNKDDTVVFSVDGIPENFTQYRKNADWNSIELAMKVCGQASCNTVWKYIPFAFNQDTVEQARQISQDLNIKNFVLELSSRFDKDTVALMPRDEFVNQRHKVQTLWKQGNQSDLEPKCASGHEHFISADGYYSPCCYVGDYNFLYKTMFSKNRNQFHIKNRTLSQILNYNSVIDFYQNLHQHPVCQYSCSSIQG